MERTLKSPDVLGSFSDILDARCSMPGVELAYFYKPRALRKMTDFSRPDNPASGRRKCYSRKYADDFQSVQGICYDEADQEPKATKDRERGPQAVQVGIKWTRCT